MTIIEAVRLVDDGNALCEALAYTTPAERNAVLAGCRQLALQMNRLGYYEPSLLASEAEREVIEAALIIRRILVRRTQGHRMARSARF